MFHHQLIESTDIKGENNDRKATKEVIIEHTPKNKTKEAAAAVLAANCDAACQSNEVQDATTLPATPMSPVKTMVCADETIRFEKSNYTTLSRRHVVPTQSVDKHDYKLEHIINPNHIVCVASNEFIA